MLRRRLKAFGNLVGRFSACVPLDERVHGAAGECLRLHPAENRPIYNLTSREFERGAEIHTPTRYLRINVQHSDR